MLAFQYNLSHPGAHEQIVDQVVQKGGHAEGTIYQLPFNELPATDTPKLHSLTANIRPSKSQNLAVFIPTYTGCVRLWVNGLLLFDNFKSSDVGDVNSLKHIFVGLPKMMGSEPAQLQIDVMQSQQKATFISKIYIGPADTLGKDALMLDLLRVHLSEIMFGASLTLLFFLLYLLSIRALGSEVVMPIVILMVVLPLLAIRCYAYEFTSLSGVFPYALPGALMATVPTFDVLFGLRPLYRGSSRLWLLGLNFAAVALTYVFLWVTSTEAYILNLTVVVPAIFVTAALAFLYASFLFLRTRQSLHLLHALTFGNVSLSIIFDLLIWLGMIDAAPISNFAIDLVAISLAMMLAHNYGVSTQKVRDNAKTNARLLAEQRGQIEQAFQRDLEAERKIIQAQEKAKLASNLHDGVLSYLTYVSALSKQDGPGVIAQIGSLVNLAMIEMRTVVRFVAHSRQATEISVLAFLAVFRDETSKTLSMAATEVEWQLLDLSRVSATSFECNLSLLRILQEAVHNAVYRGQARQVRVLATLGPDNFLTFEITNTGGKEFANTNQHGHGIANMATRAKKLGGTFSITPYPGGAQLRVVLPLGDHFIVSEGPFGLPLQARGAMDAA